MENTGSSFTQNQPDTVNSKAYRLSTLEEHRGFLRKVFDTAKTRILVVSPFISKTAIQSDHIPDKIRSATRRGVVVSVYTDNNLNRVSDGGSFKPAALDGISVLQGAGASVHIVSGIHNKTLARDEDLIAEGSFNWLSAVRTKGGVHQREERTMVFEGEEAKGMIEGEIAKLRTIQPLPAKSPTSQLEMQTPPRKNIIKYLFVTAVATGLAIVLSANMIVVGIALVCAFLYAITPGKTNADKHSDERTTLNSTVSRNVPSGHDAAVDTDDEDDEPSMSAKDMDDSFTDVGYVGIDYYGRHD